MGLNEYIKELARQKDILVANLQTKGVTASSSEKFNILIPKILQIQSGGSDLKQLVSQVYTDVSSSTVNKTLNVTGTACVVVFGSLDLINSSSYTDSSHPCIAYYAPDMDKCFYTPASSSGFIGQAIIQPNRTQVSIQFSRPSVVYPMVVALVYGY